MRLFSLLLLVFATAGVHAQNAVMDSLRNRLAQATEDTMRCKLLHELASQSWDYDFDAGLLFSRQGLNLASRIAYPAGIVQSLTDIGSYYFYKGDYVLAMDYYRQALAAAPRAAPNAVYKAETYIRIANLHRVQASFDSVDIYFRRAERCLRGVTGGLVASWYHNKGLAAIERAHLQEAKRYFQQALVIRLAEGDSMQIGESWKTLGLTYSNLGRFDSAEHFLLKVKSLALRHKNPELLIFSQIHRGEMFFHRGDLITSMMLFNEALDSLNHHPFSRYQAIVLKNIGQIFEWQGDYQNALEFFLKSLKIDEAMNARQEMARTYDMMGWLYANQLDFRNAVHRANACRQVFAQIGDTVGLADYYVLRGYIAQKRAQYTQALAFYDSCIAVRERYGLKMPLANAMKFKSQTLILTGRLREAMAYEERIYALAMERDDHYSIANYYSNMASITLMQKEYTQAEKFSLLSIRQAKRVAAAPVLRDNYLRLTSIYKSRGRFDRAVVYYDKYIRLTDSLYHAAGSARQAQLTVLYDLEKNEREIDNLNQLSILQQASLKAQTEQLRSQNLVLVLAVVGCALLAALAGVLFVYLKGRNKTNRELNRLYLEITEQKEEIQAQSEELTEANQALVQLNHQLIEKTEEIEAQSEELRETNEMITEINRDLDNSITKRTAQLKEAYKELDTFFYRSSHDFRRPLTTFMGLAEVAKITVKDNNALELFEKVKETARSLDKMLVKLQSISDVGAQELVFKEVLLKEIFYAVCDTFREEMDEKKFRVECDVSLSAPFISYPAMIRIILENLVENAIQFGTPVDPFVRLRAYQAGADCVMELEDNGQGVPRDYREKIFEMYFRGSDRSKGNGLGLYIVKKAVEKLNGSIRLDTTFAPGARFIINLPIDHAQMNRW